MTSQCALPYKRTFNHLYFCSQRLRVQVVSGCFRGQTLILVVMWLRCFVFAPNPPINLVVRKQRTYANLLISVGTSLGSVTEKLRVWLLLLWKISPTVEQGIRGSWYFTMVCRIFYQGGMKNSLRTSGGLPKKCKGKHFKSS
jgi:hypothetical protein